MKLFVVISVGLATAAVLAWAFVGAMRSRADLNEPPAGGGGDVSGWGTGP